MSYSPTLKLASTVTPLLLAPLLPDGAAFLAVGADAGCHGTGTAAGGGQGATAAAAGQLNERSRSHNCSCDGRGRSTGWALQTAAAAGASNRDAAVGWGGADFGAWTPARTG